LQVFFINLKVSQASVIMKADHFSYQVIWSDEDKEHVGLCSEFPSLSWLARSPEEALAGIRRLVSRAVRELRSAGEAAPSPSCNAKSLAASFESLRGSIASQRTAPAKSLIREGRR
jgi:hypothetical protein